MLQSDCAALLQVTWHSEDSQHQQPGHDAPAVDIRDTNGISSQHLQPGHDAPAVEMVPPATGLEIPLVSLGHGAPAVEMDRGAATYWSQAWLRIK